MAIPASIAQRFPGAAHGADDQDGGLSRKTSGYLAAAIIAAVIYPFLDDAFDWNHTGSFTGIFVFIILALGLNIVVGYAGLLDLGYAAFFAVGAYTIGLMTSPSSPFIHRGWIPDWAQNFWAAMAVSWLVAAIFGVLLGAPTLRLRGDYLAIVTLGFGEIVPSVFLNAEGLTNGTNGLNPIGKPNAFTLFGHRFLFGQTNQTNWYFLVLIVVIVTMFVIQRLHSSRLGRTWQAIREDEIAAASMGVNLVRTKLWAFGLGASFSGFAGSVYSSAFQYVAPDQFQFSVSITVLAMIILGGIGNIYGVVIGGLLIGGFDRILTQELNAPVHWLGEQLGIGWLETHDVKTDRFIVFGLSLVLMMMLRPGGILPNRERQAELRPETDEITEHESQSLAFDAQYETQPGHGDRL
jgi:branched-chain amino acid transport system permease protein